MANADCGHALACTWGRFLLSRSEEHTSELQSPISPSTTPFRSVPIAVAGDLRPSPKGAWPLGNSPGWNHEPESKKRPQVQAKACPQSAPARPEWPTLIADTPWLAPGAVSYFLDRKSTRLNSSHRSPPPQRPSDLCPSRSQAI